MPPRNDIWRVGDIRWDESLWVDACKIDYIVELIDGGIKIHLKKEEDMNKNKLLKDVDRIIIDKSYDGKTVTAVAQKRTTEKGSPFFPCMIDVAKASATCGPNDIFDFNIGAKLALDRLYEGYDMTPKPKRKPYNGLIRIVWNEDTMDTLEVVNGKLESIVYVLRSPSQQKDTIYDDSSFEEMKQALLNCASFKWHDGKPPKAICRDRVVTHYL